MPGARHTLALLHAQTIFRQALAGSIGELGPYEVVADVADVPAFKRIFSVKPPPDLLIVGVDTALEQNCAMLCWMGRYMPQVKMLLLGPEPPPPQLYNAFCAGANGHLSPDHGHDRLQRALDHIACGSFCFPETLRAYLRTRPLAEDRPPAKLKPDKPLTPRQTEFLTLLAGPGELSYVAIAVRMRITRAAVDKHVAALCKRFGLHGKGGLIKLAIDLGLGP